MPDPGRWLDPDAASAYLSISKKSLYKFISEGRLPEPSRDGLWNSAEINERMKINLFGTSKRNVKPKILKLKTINEILADIIPKWDILVGIYFLINDNKIVYVGQSNDIWARVVTHVNEKKKQFDSWSYVLCPLNELNETEASYIMEIDPPLNIARRIRKNV